jgi:hypothetical protein
MKQYIIILFGVIAFASCKKRDSEVYIPREKFIAVLTDIHLADGYYSYNFEGRKTHGDSVNLYNAVLKSYGYTKAQFDTTLRYYAVNTAKFDALYEEVVTRLNKTEQDNYLNRPSEEQSSTNIWYGKNMWILPEEGTQKRIPVNLKLKGKGKYIIYFNYKLYPDDESKNPRLNLYFTTDSSSKSKKDTLKTVVYAKDARTSIVTITKELKDSTLTHLRGYLLDHDKKDGDWEKHAVIAGLKVLFVPKQ